MRDRDWAQWAILSENSCESEDIYVQGSVAGCYRLARALWGERISLERRLANPSEVLGAARIALERAKVQRPIPRTSVGRVEEGRADSKHAEDLPRHLPCT